MEELAENVLSRLLGAKRVVVSCVADLITVVADDRSITFSKMELMNSSIPIGEFIARRFNK